jgi:hypothetical protein
MIPVLAHGLSFALGPALGLRILAASILLLLVAAIWMLSVSVLGGSWGSLAAALVIPSTAMAEPFFYGGYPQQAALAFGIFGIVALVSAKRAGCPGHQSRAFALASVCFLLASACHLLFGPLLLASGALVALAFGMGQPNWRRYLVQTAASLAPATAVSLAVAFNFVDHGYSAPLAASRRTLPEAWVYGTRESPGLWAAVVISGIAVSIAVVWRHTPLGHSHLEMRKLPEAVVAGFALTVPSVILLVASGQPRLVPPFLLGGTMLTAFTCRWAARAWDRSMTVILGTWSVAILWLAWTTTGLTREFAAYYQVLDASLVAATQSLPATNEGSIAVAADRRGWPIGWWFEALQERPVFTGSDTQWLAFPEERTRATAAAALFASPDVHVLQGRADAMGVTYLVMRKWDWIGWDHWVDGSTHTVATIYDDNETIVLELSPDRP